jgi:hypothetical protein
MIDAMTSLRTLLEKSSDADLLRKMVGFAAQRLMELEVESRPTPPTAREARSESIIATATATGSSPSRSDPRGGRPLCAVSTAQGEPCRPIGAQRWRPLGGRSFRK